MTQEIFTPGQLAPVLSKSRGWVDARCRDGRLPAIQDGTRWLLRRSDLVRDGWLTPPCAHETAPVVTGTGERHP
jgi:excisionase family DNA binding protein